MRTKSLGYSAQHGYTRQLHPLECGTKSGADFAVLCERRDAVSGPDGERFDGHDRLAARRGHQAAAIAKKKVLDVVGAVARIDHRCLRVVSRAACPEKVEAELLLPRRETPLFLRAGGIKEFVSSREHPIPELQIIRMILVRQAERRQAPRVLQVGVEREAVVFDG